MKLPTLTLVVITSLLSLPVFSDTHGWQHMAHDHWDVQLNPDDSTNPVFDAAVAADFILVSHWSSLWGAASLWTTPRDESRFFFSDDNEYQAATWPVLLIQYALEHPPERQQQTIREYDHTAGHGIYLGEKLLF